ncbi:hypothetical protein PanWU01x14_341440 [Parasponia andersonii]|uniref:Uncharacterized protein n=1 Tax=Parasponia andersonii TaxID=3476 RepID=A0A2P5AE21_PARAD|nr:hypothetical protein PanWU01x14_341440 [Parasponia andersonii]
MFHAVNARKFKSVVTFRKLHRFAREEDLPFIKIELMLYQQARGQLIKDDLNCPLIEWLRAIQFCHWPCLHPPHLEKLEVIKGLNLAVPHDNAVAFIYDFKR